MSNYVAKLGDKLKIQKINLGQMITIGANLGVIAGILLLVLELHQNRELMQAQMRSDLAESYTQIMFQLSTEEAGDILFRGSAGEELTGAELSRFNFLVYAQFGYFENVHYQYRKGLYEDTEFLVHRTRWKYGFFASEVSVEIWCNVNRAYSPEFVEDINELLDQPCE